MIQKISLFGCFCLTELSCLSAAVHGFVPLFMYAGNPWFKVYINTCHNFFTRISSRRLRSFIDGGALQLYRECIIIVRSMLPCIIVLHNES